jgi:hypothetical protein
VPAASFAHVLDCIIDAGPGPSSTAATAGILTSPLFFLDIAGPPRAVPAPPRAPRPRRQLSALQRIAVNTIHRAGAALRDDFTDAELKGAFRRLARELHPDMHPDATRDQRTALAVQFAEVRDAYEQLLKARA